jgi:hypothetical protein
VAAAIKYCHCYIELQVRYVYFDRKYAPIETRTQVNIDLSKSWIQVNSFLTCLRKQVFKKRVTRRELQLA